MRPSGFHYRRYAVAVLAALLITAPVYADNESPTIAPNTAPPPQRGLYPATLALAPGFILPGIGHYAAGDHETAYALGKLGSVGGFLAAFGGTLTYMTGSSRYISYVSIPILISGAGLLFVAQASDMYGSAGGGQRVFSAPTKMPPLRLALGYGHVADRRFTYRHFATADIDATYRGWQGAFRAWLAGDSDNQRLVGEVAYNWLDAPAVRDSVEAATGVALAYHRYGDDDFAVVTPEVFARLRYPLVRLSDSLRGAFALARVAAGAELHDYPAMDFASEGARTDLFSLRFGFGMVFGNRRREVVFFYDTRRDGYVGGIGLQPMAGFLGHFGGRLQFHLGGHWGVRAALLYGSAVVAQGAVEYQF